MEFLVKLIGRLRPDIKKLVPELPDELVQMYNVEAADRRELSQAIEAFTVRIIQMQGMLVKDDPMNEDNTKYTTERKWVPMHMIAYLRAEVKDVQGELPVLNEEGKFKKKDGTDFTVN